MPRRFVFILAADIADYSLMMSRDEAATIALVHELRDSLLEPVIARHGGEVLKRIGDGWIIAFASAGACVLAALETQNGLVTHAKTRLRIGVHMGDVISDEADHYGTGLNIACRLQTEAPSGGIMISADIFNQMSGNLAAGFNDAGTFRLKNIPRPVQCYQWRPDALAVGSRLDEVPTIAVDPMSAVPADDETTAAACDLHDQIVCGLSRRTGIKVRDLSLGLTENASTVWADVFERDATDLFGFCDTVAARVDARLQLVVNALDNNRIGQIPDEHLSVSELRTRAAGLFYECTIPDLHQSLSVLDRARRLSPNDGMSLSMWALARVVENSIRFGTFDTEQLAELTAAQDRAVELLPQSDFVFFTRALFRSVTLRDADKVMSDARRCHDLNPNYPQAQIAFGYAHIHAGQFENAVAALRKGTQLTSDPYWAYRRFHLAVAQFCGSDFDGAILTLREIIDLKPSVREFRKLLVLSLDAANRGNEARQEEAATEPLDDAVNFFVQDPPVPDSHLWLRDTLAPG